MKLKSSRFTLLGVVAAASLAFALVGAAPAGATTGGGGPFTCGDGSLPGGTYSSVTVTGSCTVDSGNVTVTGDVVVASPFGTLIAAFGGSDLVVGGRMLVQPGGALVLGCEADAFPCLNDDPHNPTMETNDRIGGNLNSQDALAVLVHHNIIGGQVIQNGGGGGPSCRPRTRLLGSPAYGTYEDNVIHGNVSIRDWKSCWMGFFRNTSTSVEYLNNATLDPDGNEFASNTINGGLRCSGNAPAPQIGDSGGSLNVVSGRVGGDQCADIVQPPSTA